MRLRPFVLKQASRADQLSRRVSPELVSAIKNLDAKDIKKLFKGFVPLDFVALVQNQNKQAFEDALRTTITEQLSTDQHRKWIEELKGSGKIEGMEDVVGETYLSMLNDDPRKRGILSEILLDGSYSDAFQYARRTEPETRLQLRQNLAPLSAENGMVVPFCPNDKSLGIDHPLWDISVENNEIQVNSGLDQAGRCITHEPLGKMSQAQFDTLEQTRQGLSEDQIALLDEGKRTLEYVDGEAVMRCTFQAQLPKFQAFLHARSRQALKSVLDPERRKMGRNIPPEKYRRRDELERKDKEGNLTIAEMSELRQLRDYFKKRQVNYVYTPTSLDAPMGGAEGEGRSRHETVSVDLDEDNESADEARFELSRKMEEREFNILEEVATKVPLSGLLKKMQTIVNLSQKDPNRQNAEREALMEAMKVAQNYYGKDQATDNSCNTCGSILGSTASSCPFADQMRSSIFSAYEASSDINEFMQVLSKIDKKAQEHFRMSQLETIINSAYSGMEIDEDDLDLDLSGFEGFQEEEPEVQEKLNTKELKSKLEDSLVDAQKGAYYGTDISSNSEVTEDDADKAMQLGQHMNKIVQDIFMQELEDELATYLIGYGAQ